MRRVIFIIYVACLIGLSGCQKAEYRLFDDVARVQMVGDREHYYNFVYKDRESVHRDTVYLTVQTMGDLSEVRRKIAFKQIPEYDITYKYDNKGNLVDSSMTEKPNKAIPGVHYVPMDSEEMQPLLVAESRMVYVKIPVILLRDTSLRREEKRLCLKLVETDDFKLGENSQLSRVVVVGDKLLRPQKWDSWYEKYQFGKYSERKHEFMIEVTQEKVDDEWFELLTYDSAKISYLKNKFKQELAKYNNDPENLAKGLAPMREDSNDPNSPLVVFP